MKTPLLILFTLFLQLANSQYYYNDIISAKAHSDRMKDYVTNKVKTISAVGYDKEGAKTTDFNEVQEISIGTDIHTLKVATRNGQQIARKTYQFDPQFRLTSLIDSSGPIKSISIYRYNNSGNIISIKTSTDDADSSEFSESEEHQWIYNSNGKPEKMWRILNGKDSTEYRLTIDEKGNAADEQLYRRGTGINPVYYYYTDNNLVSDIVRYNTRAKRLLPDFMFEYDENGRMLQKITTLSTIRPDYLIWRYAYNEKGLKTREALFTKDKTLTGRIEYQYTFVQ
jgi:hypothetical protein